MALTTIEFFGAPGFYQMVRSSPPLELRPANHMVAVLDGVEQAEEANRHTDADAQSDV